MVRKMPCFCCEPKSTLMSSWMVTVESTEMAIRESNEVMTHPSSAPAGLAVKTNTHITANPAAARRARRIFIRCPYIASCHDPDSSRYSKRRDHRARRPRKDDAGRRPAEAEPHLPRQPGCRDADHGHERPGAGERHHHPRQEHVRSAW